MCLEVLPFVDVRVEAVLHRGVDSLLLLDQADMLRFHEDGLIQAEDGKVIDLKLMLIREVEDRFHGSLSHEEGQ